MQEPGLYWQNNIMGSLNLIQAAIDHGCMDFVFSSTCATYGDQDGVVLDEDSSQHPINAYGASKRAVENILADFQAAYGLNHVIFRYFNVAVADPEAEVGEFHQPETHNACQAGAAQASHSLGSDSPQSRITSRLLRSSSRSVSQMSSACCASG